MKSEEIIDLINKSELELSGKFKKIDELEEYFSNKVLNAFHDNKVSDVMFNSTTGYGYHDLGRDTLESVYADIFNTEDAIVRNQFISGSHALNVTFFATLRPGDTLLTISGTPYDTLHEVIGIKENPSSLISWGIKYDSIDLKDNDFDYEKIDEYLSNSIPKVIHIQRSRGYALRDSISIEKLKKVFNLIKSKSEDIIIMVDNCYCEFTEKINPCEIGADLCVGSLIKNLGAGIAPNGGYVVGKKDLIRLVGERLTLPGEGKEVGPTLGINKSLYQGLFFAPSVVASSLKIAILTAHVLESLGYKVSPKWNDKRADIVQTIEFNEKEKLIKYVQGIQKGSPIDSHVLAIPSPMPGYDDEIIMASGSFTQGSSIEFSCDGPIREPFVAFQQGGLTYNYAKLGLINAIDKLIN